MQYSKKLEMLRTISLDYLIPAITLIAVAIALYFKATTMVTSGNETRSTFYALSEGMEKYYSFRTAWRPRLFSTGLAALVGDICEKKFVGKSVLGARSPLELTVGVWAFTWFVLAGLPLIPLVKRRSLFYFFGMFAGVLFGYADIDKTNLGLRLYPWDMPSLFFYAMFVYLFVKKRYSLLLFIIPIGVGFKETTIILSLGFLFADVPWKQRITFFLVTSALSLGVKIALDIYTHAPIFFTMETGAYKVHYLELNLASLKEVVPFFVNAGTLLSFYILPSFGSKKITALKIISMPFVAGSVLFGLITEYRIWFEMLPFALYALDSSIYGDPFPEQISPA